eukprot:3672855-Rhodomonas_salina.1
MLALYANPNSAPHVALQRDPAASQYQGCIIDPSAVLTECIPELCTAHIVIAQRQDVRPISESALRISYATTQIWVGTVPARSLSHSAWKSITYPARPRAQYHAGL